LIPFDAYSFNEQNYKTDTILKIGTMHSPPFSIKSDDGQWSGISIELWREIAKDSNIRYQFEEHTLQGLMTGVTNKILDAAVAAITVTELRESAMDFTHPIHSTGFSIATAIKDNSNIWLTTFGQLLSWQFMKVVLSLFVLLFLVGWLMWLLEHKHQKRMMIAIA
jgi:polar amino acid transport system substrate-binding protein